MTTVLSLLLLAVLGAALMAARLIGSSHQAGRRSAWAVVASLVAGVVLVAAPGSASAAGDVVVTVEDASGDPIEGAWVTYDDPTAYFQSTDVNGETTWSGLDAGTVDFQVLSTWWDELGVGTVTVVDGASVPLTIVADPEPAVVDVEITVEDLAGQPLDDPSSNPNAFVWYSVYVYAGQNEFGYGPDNFTQTYVSGDLVFPDSAVTLSGVPVGDRFVSVFRHSSFGARQLFAGPLTVAADPTQATVQVAQVGYGSAEITVVDQDGNTPSGATVIFTVDAAENLPWGFPDGSGSGGQVVGGVYTQTDMPADTYLATVSDNYGNVVGSTTVTVTAGTTATGQITIATGDVDVSVVDGVGDPVTEHVFVGVSSSDAVPVDAAGEASLLDVPVGVYLIAAYDPWGSWLGEVEVTVLQSPAGPAQAEIVIDPVPEYGVLEVHVEDAGGTPLENFYVSLDTFLLPSTPYVEPVYTDANGDAIFDPAPVGTYDVYVDDFNGFSTTQSVTVAASATTSLTVIGPDAPAFGDVAVTVFDENGDPAPDVYVDWDGGFAGDYTDASGQVTLVGLPVGPATLSVEDYTLGAGSTTVTVVENTTVPATINLVAPVFVDVNITVEDTNGTPVPGLEVSIDVFGTVTTDANGVAAFSPVWTGLRNVSVFEPGVFYVEYANELIDIQTDPTNATIVIPPPTYGDIEVSVVDGSGDPVTDNVSVGGYDGQFPVDAAGEAYLSGVPTGTWYVTAFDPWGNWLAETQVTVVDGGVSTAQIVIDPVPEYGVLDVHVEDADGTPLENFSVYPDAGIAIGVYVDSQNTDANGDAIFDPAPVGTYDVYVEDFNGLLTIESVTVTAGNTTNLTVIGPDAPTFGDVTVTVLDENGDPAPFVYVYEDGGFNGGFTDGAGEVTLTDLPTGPSRPVGRRLHAWAAGSTHGDHRRQLDRRPRRSTSLRRCSSR